MDRADEIAIRLWERTWDWERKEGIAYIADELRQYATEVVGAERERWQKVVEKYKHCRHGSIDCFCTAEARAALMDAQIREGSK